MEGKKSWRIKKANLAMELALIEALRSCENADNASDRNGDSVPHDGSSADSFFIKLDETAHELAGILKHIEDSPSQLQEQVNKHEASREGSGISEGSRQYLVPIGNMAKRICVGGNKIKKLVGPNLGNHRKEQVKASAHSIGSGPRHYLSPGKKVISHVFRWWRPCDQNCDRAVERLAETRMTEVDGRLVQ